MGSYSLTELDKVVKTDSEIDEVYVMEQFTQEQHRILGAAKIRFPFIDNKVCVLLECFVCYNCSSIQK